MPIGRDRIRQIIEDYFLIKHFDMLKLDSYRDSNYHIILDSGQEYVLKIAHLNESAEKLELENKAMILLRRNGVSAPEIMPNKHSNLISYFRDDHGRTHFFRLISFLPGKILAKSDHNQQLLYNIGEFLAKIDSMLKYLDSFSAHRYIKWDLRHTLDSKIHLELISDVAKRNKVDYFFLQFETHVHSQLHKLRQGLIYNDANDYNLFVHDNQISGIIDFGDMVHSCLIFEVAIACFYLMLKKEDPIAIAVEIVKGYNSQIPLEETELDMLYYLIAARLCISVCSSANARNKSPDNDYLNVTEADAWDLLDKLVEINPRDAQNEFRKACGFKAIRTENLLKKRKQLLSPSLSLSYQKPIEMIGGAYQYLFGSDAKTYLDCVNNVCHVGHCHPTVVRSIQRQAAQLNTNTRYLHENVLNYADRLTKTLPESLSVCFFVNSGSEANDLALRLARTYTNATDMIVLDHAYHGHTESVIELSPYKFDGKGGAGSQSFIHKVSAPDLYRGKHKGKAAAKKYAEEFKQIIDDLKQPLAGFIAESILSCGGQIMLPEGYLQECYQLVRSSGGVCIADEVQVGFGRVGKTFWAFELQNVVPDIVTMGKPIANGHPLAAVITTVEIAKSFNNGMEYFNTYGGNPVSAAAGLAVLDVIKSEELQNHALTTGDYFIRKLEQLKKEHQLIGDVRGSGLFLGIEFVTNRNTQNPAADQAKKIVEFAKENGILLSTDGPLHNVIKIKPPLCFTKQNVDTVIDCLDQAIKQIDR